MGLDDLGGLDYIDSGSSGSEKGSEQVSEKYKEAFKKSMAGVKRVKRDEKKAQKYDFMLSDILIYFIKNDKYFDLLPFIFRALDAGFSSNFIVGVLSLIYLPISHKIREVSAKPQISFDFVSPEKIIFDDNNLPKEVKDRINYWVEDIFDIVSIDYSEVMTYRLKKLLRKQDRIIIELIKIVFIFFFENIKIDISNSKAEDYSVFILSEVEKVVRRILEENKSGK